MRNASESLRLLDILPVDDLTASRVLARRELEQALQVAVAALPEDQRLALRLYYFDRKNMADTARELGRSEASARALVDRAKKRLQHELGRLSQYITVR